jgi:putative endonuclease
MRAAIDRQKLGRSAENAAADFLEQQRHEILRRNYRCRMGEIDLIVRSPAGTLVIVEVRMRSSTRFGGAAASVDHQKQRRVIRASRHLLATHPALARSPVRFDVLDLQPDGANYAIRWIQHAFES